MSNPEDKYNDKIYQLDELLQDIYNAVYAKTNDFRSKFIDVVDLKMSRFKLSDYNLDTIFDKTPIKYIDNFPTGLIINGVDVEQIWIKRGGETHMCTIRIVPYMNKDSIDKMTDPVNVHQVIKTLLSELVVSDKTNNILLPIVNIDVKGSDLNPYEKVRNLVDKDKYYSIQITEKFYSLITLDNFLKSYPLDQRVIKTIIYQAVDVLYQITRSYSTFRYNQFIPEVIDCYLRKNDDIIFPELKLSDFYLSEISDVISNDYLKSGQISIPYIESSYSDLYQLLNYLWNHIGSDIKKYPQLVSLFDVILPKKIRSSEIHLTKELWDQLSDEEKFELGIKNIRNSTFFTSKDSLLNTSFIETKDINDSMGGNSESSENSDTEKFTKLSEKSKINNGINKLKLKVNKIRSGSSITRTVDNKMNRNNVNDENINELSENSDDIFDTFNDRDVSPSNKKYSNNDIGNMSNKKVNRKNNFKRNEFFESENDKDMDLTDDQTERTEDRRSDAPSRIINVSDNAGSRRVSKNKLKNYRGKRYIGNVNDNTFQKENYDALINTMQRTNTQPYDNNNNVMINGVASRINSIGSALGVMPNEYNPRNQNVNYQQIAQQMAQQYQTDGSQILPTQMPSNLQSNFQSSMPNQMQNSIGQMPVMQPDADAYQRYMMASQNQTQMDPNYYSMVMQQQNAQNQFPQQMLQQMPQQQIPSMQQMGGGGKHKPFFFRQMTN
jgi:hypothetical protein